MVVVRFKKNDDDHHPNHCPYRRRIKDLRDQFQQGSIPTGVKGHYVGSAVLQWWTYFGSVTTESELLIGLIKYSTMPMKQ